MDEVATLKECLYSAGNRVAIAKILLEQSRYDLLPTILEDLFYGAQMIVDEYCVEEG